MRWPVAGLGAVAVMVICVGCKAPAASENESAHGHGHGHAGAEVKAEAPSGESVYQLESTWTDQDGKALKLGELAGKPVVLAMVYTHCEHACPRIVLDMQAIESGLTPAQREQVTFVLASIDPERDTVSRLQDFAKKVGLPAPAWRLLRSDPGAIRELAAVLGFKYRAISATDFVHSNLVTVLDRGGLILHRHEGLEVDPKGSLDALEQALRPPPPKASTP